MNLVSIVRLIRLHNALSAFLCVLLGTYLSGHLAGGPPMARALIASTVGLLVAAGAHAINDYYDVEIDRVNKPFRPLPSGRVSPHTARWLAFLLFGLALGLAAWLGWLAWLVALLLTLACCLYAAWLKRTLLANPLVGLLCAMGVVYGGMILDVPQSTVLPGTLVFLFVTSREILKTVEDYQGDALAGARTIATVCGPAAARRCYYVASLIMVGASLIPYLAGRFGVWYLLTVLIGVDLAILAAMAMVMRWPTLPSIRRALALTKVSFFAGLLAMFLALVPK